MFDLEISKLALIGAVALVVIGPEKLPRVARTAGTLLGKARRYVSDVKAEVSRSMELDELKRMKATMEDAAKDVGQTLRDQTSEFEKSWADSNTSSQSDGSASYTDPVPEYHHPKKNWRLKQGAMPNWYKARTGLRTRAMSGAARVARYRPTSFKS